MNEAYLVWDAAPQDPHGREPTLVSVYDLREEAEAWVKAELDDAMDGADRIVVCYTIGRWTNYELRTTESGLRVTPICVRRLSIQRVVKRLKPTRPA